MRQLIVWLIAQAVGLLLFRKSSDGKLYINWMAVDANKHILANFSYMT